MNLQRPFRYSRALLAALVLAAPLVLGGCGNPVLDDLDVTTGPERTLVMVRGPDMGLTSVVWDAGLPSERVIPGGFLGGYMFSVPPSAGQGVHPVALQRFGKRSKTVDFTVTSPKPFGAPHIDAVTITSASFGSGGGADVSTLLYMQGANIDVGAVVEINGSEVATFAHKGLRNELYGVDPEALVYPIYHYVALVAVAGNRPAGSTITVKVRNLDGQTSGACYVNTELKDPCTYVLPADAASLDSDGDDIPDIWETGGYGAVDLPGLGAHPHRRDIFLEVDTMIGTPQPVDGTFDMVRAMFRAAPILNPFHESGIHLYIDSSGKETVPFLSVVTIDPMDTSGATKFSTLKAAHFKDAERGRIFHYAIWAYSHPTGASGQSDINLDASWNYIGPGDDFFISLGDFGTEYQTLRTHAETLAHELGHDLGQRHGCIHSPDPCYKPNYSSVMSLAVQLRTSWPDSTRRERVTCLPVYYGDAAAVETNGSVYSGDKLRIDYSEGMAASLVENNNSLDEKKGVCGQAVDWNLNGTKTDANINADADRDLTIGGTLVDSPNWRALDFRGPRLNGASP